MNMPLTYEKAKVLLEKNKQSHLLKFWERLSAHEKLELLLQLEFLDFRSIERMKTMLPGRGEPAKAAGKMEPAPVVVLAGAQRDNAVSEGEKALRAGRVGVLLVAGGQGSRLGFEGPKGCYSIGPISSCSLFAIHARKVLALEKKYGAQVPFYIMTSDVNDADTQKFFKEQKYFGLAQERVKFFVQGMWPALWEDGRVILDRPGHLFMSPDGHGGTLSSLKSSGMLADMRKRGLQTVFYFQVDNPLVEIADPAFIGMHCLEGADMSVKVCSKRDPDEGLGVVVRRDGRDAVVEYTELTAEQKNARKPDGSLLYLYGSVAIHVFSVDFLTREAEAALPLHLAHKKVPYCDDSGKLVKPDKPNAFKFEKFIFDALPDARKAIHVAFLREDEFSPVKNAEGNDSPAMTKRDMVRKFARWMKACGVDVPAGADGESKYRIEIDPCYAIDPQDLRKKLKKGFVLDKDTLLV
jgi:UDP-N-acetylglucosamine/UDP-N-acetylgalactosamine diphosphorylase